MGAIPNPFEMPDLVRHVSRGPTGRCDYCCEQLFNLPWDRGVYWEFGGTTIWLHRQCAERLGVHLIKDSLRADRPGQ